VPKNLTLYYYFLLLLLLFKVKQLSSRDLIEYILVVVYHTRERGPWTRVPVHTTHVHWCQKHWLCLFCAI